MNTKHTSLEASKIISTALPELESEKWHVVQRSINKYMGITQDLHHFGFDYTPALNLTELIDAIQLWGEKCGWGEEKCVVCGCEWDRGFVPDFDLAGNEIEKEYSGCCGDCSTEEAEPYIELKEKQHQLLDLYLKTKDLSSKEVTEFIHNTFEV